MNFKEFGKDNDQVIILLHGGGLSWWNYREVAKMLESNYRVIIPILDGHFESSNDFTTIQDNASEIISFIDYHFKGSVLLIGGLSLGAQILLEILSMRADICTYAIVESPLVIPSKLTSSMIKPSLDCSYGLIKYEWFAKLQFNYLRMKPSLFDDYYRNSKAITKNNMIAFLKENSLYYLKDSSKDNKADIHIFVGEKELSNIKKSAKLIHKKIKQSKVEVLKNLYHGEFSINHPSKYVKKVLEIIS